MITCRNAHQLFDRYLDDELSASMRTELHAHLIECSGCQSEMALREAAGEVIRMDRSEPRLGAGFTDRLMAARRAQSATAAVSAVRHARRRRVAWYVGSPLAAAASIALAFVLVSPPRADLPIGMGLTGGPTVIDSKVEAAPEKFQENLTQLTGRQLTADEQRELAQTPKMPALSFMEAMLQPVLEGTRNTVEGTRRSAQDIELLVRYGFAGMNEQLVREYRQRYADPPGKLRSEVVSDVGMGGLGFWRPPFTDHGAGIESAPPQNGAGQMPPSAVPAVERPSQVQVDPI